MAFFSIKRIRAGIKAYLARRRNAKEAGTDKPDIKGIFVRWYQLFKKNVSAFWSRLVRGTRREAIGRWAAFAFLLLASIGIWRWGTAFGDKLNLWQQNPQIEPELTEGSYEQEVEITFPDIFEEVTPDLSSQITDIPVQPATALNIPQIIDFSQMVWPAKGEVEQEYGWYRNFQTNNWQFNPGILIVPDEPNAPISASLPGVVENIATSGSGYLVELIHAEGWKSVYQGLSEVNVTPGQRVEPGEILGRLTLAQHRPGLTFTLLQGEEYVDAMSFLP
jgi:hypothetical protein